MNTIEEDNKIVMKHTLKKINLGKNIRKIRLQRQMTRKEYKNGRSNLSSSFRWQEYGLQFVFVQRQ